MRVPIAFLLGVCNWNVVACLILFGCNCIVAWFSLKNKSRVICIWQVLDCIMEYAHSRWNTQPLRQQRRPLLHPRYPRVRPPRPLPKKPSPASIDGSGVESITYCISVLQYFAPVFVNESTEIGFRYIHNTLCSSQCHELHVIHVIKLYCGPFFLHS